MSVFIVGAGGFGTALAISCAKNGRAVFLYSPFLDELLAIERDGENKRLLPGVAVPKNVTCTDDLADAKDSELVLIAVPSAAVRNVARNLTAVLRPDAVVVCVSKGLEAQTLKTLSQVLHEALGGGRVVMLSGPSHAEEIAREIPTTVVVASRERAAAEFAQDILMTPALRLYVSDDVCGVELGGALKNIIALAAGIGDGLQLGDNPKAALLTRGITEIARLGVAMGAKSETFAGLSGIGDLIVTCTSMHSRNRRAGILIGQGMQAQEAVREIGMTVEGFACTKTAYELAAQMRVEMPIISEVYRVLYEGKPPADAIRDLMQRPKRHESEVIWLLSK